MPVIGWVLDLLSLKHASLDQFLRDLAVGELALHRRRPDLLVRVGHDGSIHLLLFPDQRLGSEAERQVALIGRIPGQVIENHLAGEQVEVFLGEVLDHVL